MGFLFLTIRSLRESSVTTYLDTAYSLDDRAAAAAATAGLVRENSNPMYPLVPVDPPSCTLAVRL